MICPDEEGEGEAVEEEVRDEAGENEELMEDNRVKISLNALSGSSNHQTLKLKGYSKKKPITILIDSGSTHNFLDLGTAKQTGCEILTTNPLWVTVADGSKICSRSISP